MSDSPTPALRLRDALRDRDFVVTADLPLRPGSRPAELRLAARAFEKVAVALQLPDNDGSRPHMSPLAAAALVLREGLDAVVRLNCRDRNRIALQADLMGAAALGITSFVLTRGGKLPGELRQQVKAVFDIGAQRLLATARAVGIDQRLVAPPGLLLGTEVAVIEPASDWRADAVERKISAGARLLQTQPCLDRDVLHRYLQALAARKMLAPVFVVVQVPLIEDRETLEALLAARRPLLIGAQDLARLRSSKNFPASAEALCRGMLESIQVLPGVAGANLGWRGDPVRAAAVLEGALAR